eukprot:6211978-Pleurochrysis_carterae.AAC.1
MAGSVRGGEARTRAIRKLKSGGYAEWDLEFHPISVLDPPAILAWLECWQRRYDKDCNPGVIRREQRSDVYFCAVAPSAHCGKVMRVAAVSVFKAIISGINHNGACRRAAVRRMTSLDSVNSRACSGGTCGSFKMCSRSRTGGGPPSGVLSLVKNRETEKDEHGGEAKTAM